MYVDNPLLKDIDKYPDSVFIFKKVKGSNVLNGHKAKDFMAISFKNIEFLKDTIQNPNEENILKALKIVFKFKDFENLRLLDFYKAYNYIVEQIKTIQESEKHLQSEPSQRLVNAGIERFSIFGSLNILDDIGQRFATPPQKVEKWSYGLIFSLSLKMKYEADVQKFLENEK